MLKQFVALVRGRVHDGGQAALAPHGITILRQQIRDCAAAVATARRAVAVAITQHGQEIEQYRRLVTRIEELEGRTTAALQQGKAELAHEAAETIARLEDERDVSERAQRAFHTEIERLKRVVGTAEARLRELQRGERIVAATDATQKLRVDGRASLGLAVLKDAEATLFRLRQRQNEIDATSTAIDEMELSNDPGIVIERLAEAGCGRPLRTSPDAVLARLAKRLEAAA